MGWFLGKGRAVALILSCILAVLGAAVGILRDAPLPPSGAGQPRSEAAAPQQQAATVSAARRVHILDGDATGGGHRPGRGLAGKSEFPEGWSDDRIIAAIEDVANDPAARREPQPNGRTVVAGRRDGVDLRVVVERDGRSIVTGYPTNAPRNRER
jgi:Bacterial EndoU nuclease